MPYRLVILGSGSKGNSLLVAGQSARVLIDMGFPQRRVVHQLAQEGLAPEQLGGIFVTHTHTDHVGDPALKFCWRHRVPLVAATEVLAVLRRRHRLMAVRMDRAGLLRALPPKGFHVNGLDVRPFQVPHDAEGPTLGYHLTLGEGPGRQALRVAVATDLGHVPPEVLRVLAESEVLILESNHDPEMLAESGRPWQLIERIRGDEGHLANHQAAEALEQILSRQRPGQLRRVVLAHLSEECNAPRLALQAAREVLARAGGRAPRLAAAAQHRRLVVLSGRRRAALPEPTVF